MHCRDPQEADIAPEVPLEDFFTLLRRQQSIDWRSVRAVLFWLSAALAIWGILACPGRMAVHWRTLSNGNLQADGWLPSWVFFPLFVGIEFLSLELWNNFEQTGYYRHWGEIGASVTQVEHKLPEPDSSRSAQSAIGVRKTAGCCLMLV